MSNLHPASTLIICVTCTHSLGKVVKMVMSASKLIESCFFAVSSVVREHYVKAPVMPNVPMDRRRKLKNQIRLLGVEQTR